MDVVEVHMSSRKPSKIKQLNKSNTKKSKVFKVYKKELIEGHKIPLSIKTSMFLVCM